MDGGTPILNPGEAAIFCLGQVVERPWVHQGKVKFRWTTHLSMSFDRGCLSAPGPVGGG